MFEVFKAEVPAREYHTRTVYPFPQMKPGQAFNVPADHPAARRNYSGGCTIASAAHSWGHKHGEKYATRRNTDDSVTVYRVE